MKDKEKSFYMQKTEWFWNARDKFKEFTELDFNPRAVRMVDFYLDLFPVGSFQTEQGDDYQPDDKGNGMLIYETADGRKKHRLVFEGHREIWEHMNDKLAYMAPISYFGRRRTLKNARYLFAMVFDLDDVNGKSLDILFNFYVFKNRLPRPTYVVNSGNGVHLYYMFDEPIPMFPDMQKKLKNLKYDLTKKIWNVDTSGIKTIQYQGINQPFRLVGSKTKDGHDTIAYKTGEKINLRYLSEFADDENKILDTIRKPKMTLDEAKEKFPEWYEERIILGRKRKSWTCKRALYDWWKTKLPQARHHHRYFYVMALTIYAVKCGIEYEELKKDVKNIVKVLNDIKPDDPFTWKDAKAAMEMYDENYRSFPRAEIQKLTGIEIPKNKRNGRKQKQHLVRARAMRDINQSEKGTKWNGRKSYKDAVYKYLMLHPDGTYQHFEEITNMKKSVFYKYRKEWLAEQENE